VRIIIIFIFGILSFLFVFLLGYFLILPEDKKIFQGKKIPLIEVDKKTETSPLKNPGKEPPLK